MKATAKITALIGCLLFCGAVSAESPPITYVMTHRIGEAFQEWLAINNLDLANICQGRKQKSECKTLSAIRDTGRGEFFLGDIAVKQAFRWYFVNGRLAEASTEYPMPDTVAQIRFLTETYGPPTSSKTVSYQNGYGATWDCLEATWDMPDGATIRAVESIKQAFGPTRWLDVTFTSKEFMKFRLQRLSPNPYK